MHSFSIASKPVIASILLLAFIAEPINACTVVRFKIGDDFLVARNHDWPFGEGLIVVQPRGCPKPASRPSAQRNGRPVLAVSPSPNSVVTFRLPE